MVVEVGATVPPVTGRDQNGEAVRLEYDRPTVLFFYPEDGTPGCTREAEQFNLERETYEEAGVRVVGVSTDSVGDHREFVREQNLELTLLADPEGALVETFGVETDAGRVARTTIVVDGGTVHETYENVTPDGHAREVLMGLLDDGLVELPAP